MNNIKTILSVFLFVVASATNAQTTYNIPASVRTNQVVLSFEKVKSSSSNYYINYKAKNVGNGVLVIDRSEASLSQNGGEMHPTSGVTVLKSGEDKTIYNTFKVRPPVQANADLLNLTLHGIRYAMDNGATLPAEKLILGSGVTQQVGDFGIKVMEYNVYDDRVFAEVKCSYNGGNNRAGKINLTNLVVEGGKAEIVKKGDVVFSGDSYTFAINITPGAGGEYALNWTNVFSVLNLVPVSFDPISIKSTNYKEPTDSVVTNVAEEAAKPVQTNAATSTNGCELTYSEFSALREDLKSEVESGGKPVAMANEYLMVKGCISTAQVVDLMAVFNLDAPRLEFAKMAYKFTSDKNKYHLAVQKLAYNKNKEALEEFLGQQ